MSFRLEASAHRNMGIKRNRELFEKVETLQNMLVSYATGGNADHDEYKQMRAELVGNPEIQKLLPSFIRVNRDLGQMWTHFKRVSSTYQGRREYLWKEFAPLLDALEPGKGAPGDERVEAVLAVLSSASVHSAWQTALERRTSDPDGAITSARTLLEPYASISWTISDFSMTKAVTCPVCTNRPLRR